MRVDFDPQIFRRREKIPELQNQKRRELTNVKSQRALPQVAGDRKSFDHPQHVRWIHAPTF